MERRVAEPEIHVMCGLVGAGKTTLAMELGAFLPAVRFSRDEWMIRLFALGYDDPEYGSRLASCTALMWDVAASVLATGTSVVLDWSHWSRQQRAEVRDRAATAGCELVVHFVDVSISTALRQVEDRNASAVPNGHRTHAADVRHFETIFEPPSEDEGFRLVVHRR